MYYQDLIGKLHFLDSADFEYLLPSGCKKISDEEATALQPKGVTHEIEKQESIAKLHELDMQSIRAIREYIVLKSDAPQELKEIESHAEIERMKLKPD